jgi:hypothetical protein
MPTNRISLLVRRSASGSLRAPSHLVVQGGVGVFAYVRGTAAYCYVPRITPSTKE